MAIDLASKIRTIPDFPIKGVLFRDVTTLFKDAEGYHELIDRLAASLSDRQVDIAWLAEGDKVSGQMERFRRNIDRILLSGGTPADKERWTEYYHVYQCAINATKDAYMPNAQRKKEYLRIYEDVARQNEILVSYLAKRQNATATSTLLNATDNRTLHKGGIVRNAMSRWQESRLAVRGSQSGSNGNGEDDNESVNRGK